MSFCPICSRFLNVCKFPPDEANAGEDAKADGDRLNILRLLSAQTRRESCLF